MARRCAGADLDGDGEISKRDAARASALVGLPPGPSGLEALYADCIADINDDGVVKGEDLRWFARGFGTTDCVTAV